MRTAARPCGWLRPVPQHAAAAGDSPQLGAVGTEVVIDGYQSKDLSMRANGRNMTFANGETLFMGSSGTGAPRDGADSTEAPRPNDDTESEETQGS